MAPSAKAFFTRKRSPSASSVNTAVGAAAGSEAQHGHHHHHQQQQQQQHWRSGSLPQLDHATSRASTESLLSYSSASLSNANASDSTSSAWSRQVPDQHSVVKSLCAKLGVNRSPSRSGSHRHAKATWPGPGGISTARDVFYHDQGSSIKSVLDDDRLFADSRLGNRYDPSQQHGHNRHDRVEDLNSDFAVGRRPPAGGGAPVAMMWRRHSDLDDEDVDEEETIKGRGGQVSQDRARWHATAQRFAFPSRTLPPKHVDGQQEVSRKLPAEKEQEYLVELPPRSTSVPLKLYHHPSASVSSIASSRTGADTSRSASALGTSATPPRTTASAASLSMYSRTPPSSTRTPTSAILQGTSAIATSTPPDGSPFKPPTGRTQGASPSKGEQASPSRATGLQKTRRLPPPPLTIVPPPAPRTLRAIVVQDTAVAATATERPQPQCLPPQPQPQPREPSRAEQAAKDVDKPKATQEPQQRPVANVNTLQPRLEDAPKPTKEVKAATSTEKRSLDELPPPLLRRPSRRQQALDTGSSPRNVAADKLLAHLSTTSSVQGESFPVYLYRSDSTSREPRGGTTTAAAAAAVSTKDSSSLSWLNGSLKMPQDDALTMPSTPALSIEGNGARSPLPSIIVNPTKLKEEETSTELKGVAIEGQEERKETWRGVAVSLAKQELPTAELQQLLIASLQEGAQDDPRLIVQGRHSLELEMQRTEQEMKTILEEKQRAQDTQEALLARHMATLRALNGDAGSRFAATLERTISRSQELAEKLANAHEKQAAASLARLEHCYAGAKMTLAKLNSSYRKMRLRIDGLTEELQDTCEERDEALRRVDELERLLATFQRSMSSPPSDGNAVGRTSSTPHSRSTSEPAQPSLSAQQRLTFPSLAPSTPAPSVPPSAEVELLKTAALRETPLASGSSTEARNYSPLSGLASLRAVRQTQRSRAPSLNNITLSEVNTSVLADILATIY